MLTLKRQVALARAREAREVTQRGPRDAAHSRALVQRGPRLLGLLTYSPGRSRAPATMAREHHQERSALDRRSERILLTRTQQAASGSLGLGALTTGALAVFTTDNEAGSTALLIVGALLMIITLAKRVPDALTAWDAGLVFKAGQESGVVAGAAEAAATAAEAAEQEGVAPEEVAEAVRSTAAALTITGGRTITPTGSRVGLFDFIQNTHRDRASKTAMQWFGDGLEVGEIADRSGITQVRVLRLLQKYRQALSATQSGVSVSTDVARSTAALLFGAPIARPEEGTREFPGQRPGRAAVTSSGQGDPSHLAGSRTPH